MRAGEKFRWEDNDEGGRGRRHLWQGGRKKKEHTRRPEERNEEEERELKEEEERRKVQGEGWQGKSGQGSSDGDAGKAKV